MSLFSSRSCHLLLRNLVAVSSVPSLQNTAYISTGCSMQQANYYEALGISKSSTQVEIKAAYYRLSMQYHPDKNKGSESAAIKFREITQAYEVLGNFRLRKLYDKGIIHTAGGHYAETREERTVYDTTSPQPEDDPETRFYKSRFRKSKVADEKGRTPIYNFDEWTRQHYGATFERRQTAKQKYDRMEARKIDQMFMTQKELLLLGMLLSGFLIYYNFIHESSYDTPKAKAERAAEEKKLRKQGSAT